MAEPHTDQMIGAYQVVGRLGGGAMGTVHLARSPSGRLVAVKVVRAELAEDPRFRERFRREIDMARAVGGFWTAAVVDADPDAVRPWLATEYVPGPDLHEAVRTSGAFPQDAVRGLAAGLAEALAAIHSAGLVHRDLKPSNVLLAADGPRVIDFGISKALEGAGLTYTGMVIGTPGYLSPEQIEGREVGPASDVFAFGAVVVFAASGRNPFGEGDTAALLYRAVHTKPDLRDVPHEMRELVGRCLDRTAERRPTAVELVTALGGRVDTDWMPVPVRTIIEQRRTELLSVRPTDPAGPRAGAQGTKMFEHGGPHPTPRTMVRWWLERGEHSGEAGPDRKERKRQRTEAEAAQAPAEAPPGQPHPNQQHPSQQHPVPPSGAYPQPSAAHPAPPSGAHAQNPSSQIPHVQTPAAQPSGGYPAAAPHQGAQPSSAQPVAQAPVAAPQQPVKAAWEAGRTEVPRVLGKWWAKAVALAAPKAAPAAPPVPEPEPEPAKPASPAEALADRVNRLVEQAREAMGEPSRKSPAKAEPREPAPAKEAEPAQRKKAKARKETTPPPVARGSGNAAVFQTARGPRLLAAGVGGGMALLCVLAAQRVAATGSDGLSLLVLLFAVAIALLAGQRLVQGIVPKRAVEVTAHGLTWRRGSTTTTLKWPRIARVRVVHDRGRSWLVVWPRDPDALPGKADFHGGFKAYPIAHERGGPRRGRELRELRAALSWYGRSAYDPGE